MYKRQAYDVSTVRASEKVKLSQRKSRPHAFLPAIDEVRTLPLSPPKVAQKANLLIKKIFPHISVLDEANDFKFGMQLKFAKAHHQIPLAEKVGVVLGWNG